VGLKDAISAHLLTVQEYNEEIERLKKDLTASREKNGIFLSPEHYQYVSLHRPFWFNFYYCSFPDTRHLQSQAEAQQAQIDELTERIEAIKEEMAKVAIARQRVEWHQMFPSPPKRLMFICGLTAQTQSLFEETSRDLVRVTTQLKYFLRLHAYRSDSPICTLITTFSTSTEG
jgi:hypothetical protein